MSRDLSWVTRIYLNDFDDPDVMDQGWCYVWAWLAKLGHPDAQLVIYDASLHDAHALILLDDRYYDRSKPRGVKDPRKLRWFNGRKFQEWDLEIVAPDRFRSFRWSHVEHNFGTQGLLPWPSALPRGGPRRTDQIATMER
jgi:hypothetical protein